jgi:hypothetical protein
MKPMPPSHWVSARQKSRLGGIASTSVKIEAPVVVKPETVSKKASVKDGIAPENKKGSEPKKEKSSQPKVTMANPSLARRSPVILEARRIAWPIPAVIPAESSRLGSAPSA